MLRAGGNSDRSVVALPTVRRLTAGAVVACAALVAFGAIAGPAAAAPKNFYGVVPQRAGSSFPAMAGAGVSSIRLQANWARIQPTRSGSFRWARLDDEVHGATQNGIRPLLMLNGAPRWATGCSKHHCDTYAPVGSKKARRAWKAFCAAVANRYGSEVGDYQIWNEENSPTRYKPKPSPSRYAKLLKIGSKAIRGADPGARIVLGGMFGTPDKPQAIFAWKFLKRLYEKHGIKRSFDVVALHPYSSNLEGIKLQIKLALKPMRQAGDGGTPIWITELGWGSNHSSSKLSKGAKGQARMLKKSAGLLRRHRSWNIQRYFWFSWQDGGKGAICDWCWATGLVKKDGTRKPAYHAYRKLAR